MISGTSKRLLWQNIKLKNGFNVCYTELKSNASGCHYMNSNSVYGAQS